MMIIQMSNNLRLIDPLSSHIHHNQEQDDMEDEFEFQPDARVWLDTYASELALPPDLPTSPPPVSQDDEAEESAHVAISFVENSAEKHDAFSHPNSNFSTVSSHVDLPYFLQHDQRFKAYKAVQENPDTPTWR
jgi:hypothetical protein